jgi:hypothetical protein
MMTALQQFEREQAISRRKALEAKDAEIASLRALHDVTLASCEVLKEQEASLRAELEEAKFQLETYPYAVGYDRGKEYHREELDRLRATARQDAEEKARLRYAVEQALADTGYGGNKHCGDNTLTPHTVELLRAALACRPQGEKS